MRKGLILTAGLWLAALYSENRKRLWRVSGDAAGGGCAGNRNHADFR